MRNSARRAEPTAWSRSCRRAAHVSVRDRRADADAVTGGRPRSRPTASDRAGSPCDAARSCGPFVFGVLPRAPTRLTQGRPTREDGHERGVRKENAYGPDDGRLPPLAQRDELLAGDHWRGRRGGAGRRRARRLGARARKTTRRCAPSCATSSSRRTSTRPTARQRERFRADGAKTGARQGARL